MSSLQDQLLKSGLVDKSRANKAKKDKQKQERVSRKTSAPVATNNHSNAQQKRAERDRALNQQKQELANKKAVAAQIKQLIDTNKLERKDGEIRFSFVFRNKVKYLTVNADMKQALAKGQLAIVTQVGPNDRFFELVPAAVADKIAERDANVVISQVVASQPTESSGEADPYADFEIPDDLIW